MAPWEEQVLSPGRRGCILQICGQVSRGRRLLGLVPVQGIPLRPSGTGLDQGLHLHGLVSPQVRKQAQ